MGFGKARSWNSLGEAVFAALGQTVQIEYADMPDKLRDQYQYFTEANMKKWLAAGMSEPKWSLEAGVSDYVKNYLSRSCALL
jgi:ADP-L-glycero-D-manno-heptose 6-epimerase